MQISLLTFLSVCFVFSPPKEQQIHTIADIFQLLESILNSVDQKTRSSTVSASDSQIRPSISILTTTITTMLPIFAKCFSIEEMKLSIYAEAIISTWATLNSISGIPELFSPQSDSLAQIIEALSSQLLYQYFREQPKDDDDHLLSYQISTTCHQLCPHPSNYGMRNH